MDPSVDSRPQKRTKNTDTPIKTAVKSQKRVAPSKQPVRIDNTKTTSVAFVDRSSELDALTANTKVKSAESASASPSKTDSVSTRRTGKTDTKISDKVQKKSREYPATFKIVAGTYERLLYGLEGSFISEDGTPLEKPRLRPIFIFPAHVSCVKAVAASPDGGKWLATGSTDEIIKIWDLRKRKEIGGLLQHKGSITHLTFPTRAYLVSASEDGTISIFRTRDWILLRSLKGHKGRVNSVAVHHSGKVALSVGQDRMLRMWDLMRGKGSASTKLGKEGELVRWSTDGEKFIVQSGSVIDIYSTDMALLHTVTHNSRIHDALFFRDHFSKNERELLFLAAEDKKVTIFDTSGADSTSLPVVGVAIGHENRVKAMDVLDVAVPASPRSWSTILSTVSSDGRIRIFDLGLISQPSDNAIGELTTLTPIAEYDTKGSRLTCCTLADGEVPSSNMLIKRKHLKEDVDSDLQKTDEQDGLDEDALNENTDGAA